MFSKKAKKIDKIFTVELASCSKFQIGGEDFVKFCGLLRKHELYGQPPKVCKCILLKSIVYNFGSPSGNVQGHVKELMEEMSFIDLVLSMPNFLSSFTVEFQIVL